MEKAFQYVDYLWDEEKVESLVNDQVTLFLYRSNILGQDLRIVNYSGGNTRYKTTSKNLPAEERKKERGIVDSFIERFGIFRKSDDRALYR